MGTGDEEDVADNDLNDVVMEAESEGVCVLLIAHLQTGDVFLWEILT